MFWGQTGQLWANPGCGCAEHSHGRVPSQNPCGAHSGVGLGGTGRAPPWRCRGGPTGAPKTWDTPSRECGERFPPQSHWWLLQVPWCDVGAKSLIPLGSAAAQAPSAPSPNRPCPFGGCRWPRAPPGAASTGGVALAGGTRPVGRGARGQSRGKGVGVGVPGLGPPRLGVWGTLCPPCHLPVHPAHRAGAEGCPTAGTAHNVPLSFCPCAPVPHIPKPWLGTERGWCQELLAFICSIK